MDKTPKNGVMIAFGELFLKSEGVKKLFQKRLVDNLRFFLAKNTVDFKLFLLRERIFIETEQPKAVIKVLKNIFGISWFAECLYFPESDLKEFGDFVDKNYHNWIKSRETFAINLKMSDVSSSTSLATKEVIERIARRIDRKVNLNNPKKELSIEIRKQGWFLYFKKQRAQGGLPFGASGRVLVLMSGGIDSPVAAHLISKRGAENVWLHFHSFPLVSNKSIEKIKEIARIFSSYQAHLKIYFVPISRAQVEIKTKAPAGYRILLYRRLMFRIAEAIAKKERCKALVTGESLGQVSSQTLQNITIVSDAIRMPVFRPLIAMDKEEIIKLAEQIKTYEISIKPHEDCCTLFTPKHSTADGKLEVVKELEKKLNIKKIVAGITKEIKVMVQ
ncbi:MAG: tRNA uracil 4-sulfurtransferase ThiI [Candidatus Staskawiczbacteria bacterium]|jgi:thiamine biosynthesis protein ThiI